MTREELDERIGRIVSNPTLPSEEQQAQGIKQLIRDCIEAVTPKRIDLKQFADAGLKQPEISASLADQSRRAEAHNATLQVVRANTEELLG